MGKIGGGVYMVACASQSKRSVLLNKARRLKLCVQLDAAQVVVDGIRDDANEEGKQLLEGESRGKKERGGAPGLGTVHGTVHSKWCRGTNLVGGRREW
jgi:hypothetical protein